jgi:hypothetical protein
MHKTYGHKETGEKKSRRLTLLVYLLLAHLIIGFRVAASELSLGYRVKGLGLRVKGLGFRV